MELIPETFFEEMTSWLLLVGMAISIAGLTKGADWLVNGAVGLAKNLGINKIIIGATVVSLGTTAPECAVSVAAAWQGKPGLALGNAVGSVIANTGLVFGLCCVIAMIPLNRFVLNRHGWVQVGAAGLLALIALGLGTIPRWVGMLFVVILGVYLIVSIRWARQYGQKEQAWELEHKAETHEKIKGKGAVGVLKDFGLIVVGLALVIFFSKIMVGSVTVLARRMHVPEDVLAVTLVAFGTSLPELVTAIAAVAKGHKELMVGNIVGANILNVLFVVGFASLATPLEVPHNFYTLHFPVMLTTLVLFRIYIFISKTTFRRWQGVLLLMVYGAYLVLLFTK